MMDLIDFAEKLSPYQELLAEPSVEAPEYVHLQYRRWISAAEQFILLSSDDDIAATLRPHCLRRVRVMGHLFGRGGR